MRFFLLGVQGEPERHQKLKQRNIQEYIEPVKTVLGMFIHESGEADYWMELVLGNKGKQRIRIDRIDVKIMGSETGVTIAPSENTAKSKNDNGYLYREDPDSGWKSMYEDFTRFGNNNPYFNDHFTTKEDKIFAYTLGEKEREQRVVATPVEFDTYNDIASDSTRCKIRDIRTLESGSTPVLHPKDGVANNFAGQSQNDHEEYVDAITLWIYWNAKDLVEYHSGGEFTFRFNLISHIGPVSHYYAYYTLPQKARFIGSQGGFEVNFWREMVRERVMFQEWRRRYSIKRVGRGGTGTARNMLRSKAGEVTKVGNSGDYRVRKLQRIEKRLSKASHLTLAIIGTLLVQNLILPMEISLLEQVSLSGGILVIIGVVLMIINSDPITLYIGRLSELLDRF